MKNNMLFIVIFLLSSNVGFTHKNDFAKLESQFSSKEIIPIYNFDSLEHLLYTNANKTFIVNFWAMWCGPCIKELPLFQEYEKNNPNAEVLLVSLDFVEDIETKLKPFLKLKGITSKVVLLDDPDANVWINKIDSNWSGAIPFTIIFNNKSRSYHEGAFKDYIDLENKINNTINK